MASFVASQLMGDNKCIHPCMKNTVIAAEEKGLARYFSLTPNCFCSCSEHLLFLTEFFAHQLRTILKLTQSF